MLFRLGCLTLPAFDSFFQCGPLITCVSSLGLEQARYYIGSDLDPDYVHGSPMVFLKEIKV